MRSMVTLLTLAALAPLSAQGTMSAQARERASEPTFAAYDGPSYRPVRAGDVRSSGFLTEQASTAFGRLIGPVDPPLVRSAQTPAVVFPGTIVAVQPPEGATYQRGDTVLIALVVPAPTGWGSIIIPTGLARIGDRSPRQTLATVIAMYGPVRGGAQVVLPLEPLSNPGDVQPVTVAGPSGELITSREPREVSQTGEVFFINIGRSAGMRIGDFVEIRRRAGPRANGADTIDDVMGVAQVVHVGEKSSTIKLTRVIDPTNIRAGTPVVRIATLPN
jgi:hypothetical protein